jgi:multidrug resistance protein, MATE family
MKKLLLLALPVALSHLLVMTMGLVDLAFVRHVGTTATGAVGVSSALFGWTLTVGMGLLAGMDFFISTAYGAGQWRACHLYFGQGIWLALLTGVPLSLVLYLSAFCLPILGINPAVIPETAPFLKVLSVGLVPVFVFGACRNYLQATNRPLAPFFILLIANFANVFFNNLFIFGGYGIPPLGATGCAVSTSLCRISMAGVLLAYVLRTARRGEVPLVGSDMRLRFSELKRLVWMGVPASMQMVLEVGVFGLSTVLAGGLDAESLAAHQIVLNVASVTFMVPLGIGAATAVLVGRNLGRRDPKQAGRTGWMGLGLSLLFMVVASGMLLFFPDTILGGFSGDKTVLLVAHNLLLIAALFQISDGMQASLTGALRGLGDTRTPVLANFVGHWIIGTPLSLWLCFGRHWGVSGIWVGLAIGLSVVALWLLLMWAVRLRQSDFKLDHLDTTAKAH